MQYTRALAVVEKRGGRLAVRGRAQRRGGREKISDARSNGVREAGGKMKQAHAVNDLERADMALLGFCHLMASTARSRAAKTLFQHYLRHEFQHLQKRQSCVRRTAGGMAPSAV